MWVLIRRGDLYAALGQNKPGEHARAGDFVLTLEQWQCILALTRAKLGAAAPDRKTRELRCKLCGLIGKMVTPQHDSRQMSLLQ